jgi:hypothetical protein
MSHFGENVIARERSDRSNLLSQHNEIASPPSAARNDKCDIVEVARVPYGNTETDGGDFMKDSIPEIGLQQINAILKYLSIFEKQDYQFGQWVEQEGQFPYFSFSPEVDEFIGALHKQNMIIPFDWKSWRAEAKRYQSDPDALEAVDLLTLRKLLTAHVRADRFTEGHLANVFESEHITAILRRLKQIRDEMT